MSDITRPNPDDKGYEMAYVEDKELILKKAVSEKKAKSFGFRMETKTARIDQLQDIAVQLMPAFRDKYDFSNSEKDHAAHVDIAFVAAEAVLKKRADLLAKAQTEAEAEVEKEFKGVTS